ncbi:angiogenic factor with G patch and FHA domains 1-like isoform X2 [Ylistrum balloti]|uniref:angiogenic factor with G patch and FHA domains 1-like isoform X2 n=1 Tax=Ylistrum balloti TaxID=509963 RepID=UPI002905D0E3|nr:angiogenic factor with G patch and FHA domains 1-like isoform X2 [Ylistrum balloti]
MNTKGQEDETDNDAQMTESAKPHGDGKTYDNAKSEEGTKTESDNKHEVDNETKIENEVKSEEEEKKLSSTSLADELRATAEAAVQQSGYVYDEKSGLYYDYNSGYYYSAEKALYYDPNTGTYFYYNSETGKYEFHSQVDLSQYSTGQDSQQHNQYYGLDQYRDHHSSSRGDNYDKLRRNYHTHASHRPNDSGYHKPLQRRDRDTSRSSQSYADYDRHISSHRRDKEGSINRTASGRKKQSKRLQSEEKEYHKRKKKKKDKDKKKRKKSSKERRKDRSSDKKRNEKYPQNSKRKVRESREKSEDGEVVSEDSDERDDDSKEGDEDNKENSSVDLESYDLEGKSYMGELYESFDENSNNEVTSGEASTMDNLYDDLDDDIVQQSASEDDGLSKRTEDYLYTEGCNHNENDRSDMEYSTNMNVSSEQHEKTKYSKRKKIHNSKDSASNSSGKLQKKKISYSSSDSDTAHKEKSHSKEHDSCDRNITSKIDSSYSHKHLTKKNISDSSHRHENSRSGSDRKSRDEHSSKHKSGEMSGVKRRNYISETSGKKHRHRSGKQGRKATVSRHYHGRQTSSQSRKQPAFSSDSDSRSSSNSLCTGESELESGEITSTSDEEPEAMQCDNEQEFDQDMYGDHSHDVIMAEEELVSKWPPCIRLMVTDSDIVDPGTLFIVTCTGATVGREKGHIILIPDINISKTHAEIHFDETEYQYFLTDLASQNGTFLNEERVSEPKEKSKPKVLNHGDTLQFGCTRLLLHIHDGMDTCDECEPGQVQAQLQAQNQSQKEIVILSKEEKQRQQKQQLKKIKKKYGLKDSAYVDNMSAINNPAYNDKADERRKTVGSDNPYQPDEAPASVHRPISEENKGHKMLKKLGWTEGESLGKDNEGIRQPISVKFRANRSAGLGSGDVGEGSVEEVGDLHRRQKWLEVQRRYNKMEEEAPGGGNIKKTLTTPKWVQGETQES